MLTVNNLTVSYSGRPAVSGVTFVLRAGTLLALLGPNGAGKTSLIRALNASLAAAQGSVEFESRMLHSLSRREIASGIAVVAQENETRFPVTVLEFVLAGRFVQGGAFGWESDADIAAAQRALFECDLAGYEARLMNELSGGERQRVVLARAIATNARLFLLDEPTANLDLAHQASMFRLVRDKCRSEHVSAVVITHDLNLAAEFAHAVLVLKDGLVRAVGEPAEVFTAEMIAHVFGVEVLVDTNPASGNVRVTNVF